MEHIFSQGEAEMWGLRPLWAWASHIYSVQQLSSCLFSAWLSPGPWRPTEESTSGLESKMGTKELLIM